MAEPKQLTKDEFVSLIEKEYDESQAVIGQISKWIDRGDGAAIYRNEAFDHSQFGTVQIVSYGSSAAQIESDEPPKMMPNIGNAINWPYCLEATYHG